MARTSACLDHSDRNAVKQEAVLQLDCNSQDSISEIGIFAGTFGGYVELGHSKQSCMTPGLEVIKYFMLIHKYQFTNKMG